MEIKYCIPIQTQLNLTQQERFILHGLRSSTIVVVESIV